MAEKNFFDLFKAKLSELNPSTAHHKADWEILSGHLDEAMPVQKDKRRNPALIIPLLLATALVSSNAVWWNARQNDHALILRLQKQVETLQKNTSVNAANTLSGTVRDTVWRTIYVRVKEKNTAAETRVYADLLPEWFKNRGDYALNSAPTAISMPENQVRGTIADFSTLTTIIPGELKRPQIHVLPDKLLFPPLADKPVTRRFRPISKPRSIDIGAQAGWMYALSSGLMHEGGGAYGVSAGLSFYRHWRLSAAFESGRIHYKAHDPAAVIGVPAAFAEIFHSQDHHLLEMDVTGQRIRQMSIGLDYVFGTSGKPQPRIGLGWACRMILPFSIDYEIQHESNGAIEKGAYDVPTHSMIRNIAVLNTGLDIPLSARWGLGLKASYFRQWKKTNAAAPDLLDIGIGIRRFF